MIYVGCPANVITGGPMLAHQLCYVLNTNGIRSKMYYYSGNEEIVEWGGYADSPYGKYGLEAASTIEEIDSEGNAVFLPETSVWRVMLFSNITPHIWWMSVDHFLLSAVMQGLDLAETTRYFLCTPSLHLVQSKYAEVYCSQDLRIPANRVLYLTDYTDETYITESIPPGEERKNCVYYNHAKSSQSLIPLMEQYPDVEWVAIKNMTAEQVADAFRHGKVYVDFGPHPGKDRMPREAAACGCCIITNKMGAAAYSEDVPINEEYKFIDPVRQMEQVMSLIQDCFDHYDERVSDFSEYREWIYGEKDRFVEEALKVAERLEVDKSN